MLNFRGVFSKFIKKILRTFEKMLTQLVKEYSYHRLWAKIFQVLMKKECAMFLTGAFVGTERCLSNGLTSEFLNIQRENNFTRGLKNDIK